MGRSSSSCLKIIACGSSDAATHDDIDETHETKALGDKRGWSFRKKSGRHQALGNNVSPEAITVKDKEIPQGANTDFQAPLKSLSLDEKSQSPRPHEKKSEAVFASEPASESKMSVVVSSENDDSAENTELKTYQDEVTVENGSNATPAEAKMASPAVVVSGNDSNTGLAVPKIGDSVVVSEVITNSPSAESEISVSASQNGGVADATIDEPAAIIIQAAVRGSLAQKAFVQLKSSIKLQAAIRGHLVRRNAVETLHCIRAIVKVQTLVRAHSSKSLDQKDKPNETHFSTVKLLRNGFARQLLESTPKLKSVNIRCDPLRPNSAWAWLERWMSVSISETDLRLEHTVECEDNKQDQETPMQANAEFEPLVISNIVTATCNTNDVAKSQENEKNLIGDVSTNDSLACYPLSTEVKTEQSHPQKSDILEEGMDSPELDALNQSSQMQEEPISLIVNSASESEQPKFSTKHPAPEELDNEGKTFVHATRKASNPAFMAAQSKFEELSAAAKSGTSVGSFLQDVGAESYVDTTSAAKETLKKANEPTVKTEPCDLQSHVAGSECGTELSISSTLDSPDRPDLGNSEVVKKKFLEETCHDVSSRDGSGGEVNGLSRHSMTDLPRANIQQEEACTIDDVSGDSLVAKVSIQEKQKLEMNASDLRTNIERASSMMAMDSSQIKQKHELNDFDAQLEDGSRTEHQGLKSSPEASPKSHRTVLESQGTPSSQISTKSKRNKHENSGSNSKRSTLSAGKKSPSNPSLDSGARSSIENLPKDHKSGKRRNSFGSSKSDNVDHEPRDSSTRNSLPSYMQATESARAKAHSPRSSPDVHEKEVSSKKRHSLPGAGGKGGSPRFQRSTSQAAQERKWQR